VSAYFGKMKEGEYPSARGPKVWPDGNLLVQDIWLL